MRNFLSAARRSGAAPGAACLLLGAAWIVNVNMTYGQGAYERERERELVQERWQGLPLPRQLLQRLLNFFSHFSQNCQESSVVFRGLFPFAFCLFPSVDGKKAGREAAPSPLSCRCRSAAFISNVALETTDTSFPSCSLIDTLLKIPSGFPCSAPADPHEACQEKKKRQRRKAHLRPMTSPPTPSLVNCCVD